MHLFGLRKEGGERKTGKRKGRQEIGEGAKLKMLLGRKCKKPRIYTVSSQRSRSSQTRNVPCGDLHMGVTLKLKRPEYRRISCPSIIGAVYMSQQVRLSGIFCCRPNDLELSAWQSRDTTLSGEKFRVALKAHISPSTRTCSALEA